VGIRSRVGTAITAAGATVGHGVAVGSGDGVAVGRVGVTVAGMGVADVTVGAELVGVTNTCAAAWGAVGVATGVALPHAVISERASNGAASQRQVSRVRGCVFMGVWMGRHNDAPCLQISSKRERNDY
jgi:hypothetical protein